VMNVYPLVGDNSLRSALVAAVAGALMYFPVLTEVALVKALLASNLIALGPALSLLLAGPGVSLPGAVLLSRFFGWRKTAVYLVVETMLCAGVGYLFGITHRGYSCACQLGSATLPGASSSIWVAMIYLTTMGIALVRLRQKTAGRGGTDEVKALP